MSDKPIYAEIVRADQIKVGESYAFLTTGKAPLCSMGDVVPLWTRGSENEPGWIPGQIVARILPEPVEVREYWRIKYERFAIIDGKECWLNGAVIARDTGERALEALENRYPANREHIRNPIIEHVRETVLSREEVRND